MTGPRILYVDIETSPIIAYVWGLRDQNVGINQIIRPTRVLCAAWQFEGEEMQFAAEWNGGGRRRMIKRLHAALDEADIVVHYNGQSFDVPHLNREFLEVGLGPPSPFKQVDLYLTIRRAFRFPSNKLEYISTALKVAGGKLATGGMELWTEVLAGKPDARTLMEKYNCQDVVVTRDLYQRILPWISSHPNMGVYSDDEDLRCTACGSAKVQRRGYTHTAAGRYARFRCSDCGRWSRAASRAGTTPLRAVV